MKVFVVGSMRHLPEGSQEREQMQTRCRMLGGALARRKHTIIVNSERPVTVDPYIVDGANGVNPGSPHRVIVFRPEPGREKFSQEYVKPFGNRTESLRNIEFDYRTSEGNYRTSHLRSLLEADIVLAIGGSPRGTGTVVYSAEAMKKPVALIKTFGGEASDAWIDFGRYYVPEIREVFERHAQDLDNAWADDIVIQVESLAATNPFDETRGKTLFMIGAIGVASTVGWFASFFYLDPNSMWRSLVPLLGMGLFASLFGSGLRRAALRTRLMWVGVQATHPILEWFVGIGVALLLLLLAVVGGVTLTLRLPDKPTLGDLRHVGLTISIVTVLSSLFVEYAWQRINSIGKRKLEEF